MTALGWIVAGGIAMSAIALVGSVSMLMQARDLQRLLLPLVAFAAGTLLGGALLHMLPGAIAIAGAELRVFVWLLAGFVAFFVLEQFMHWHHRHDAEMEGEPQPLTYLVLLGDGLHNFLGGLAVGGAFIVDVRLGISAWIAAAAHEVPQEIGDFAVLVHGGWTRSRALLFNLLSASTFLVGGLAAWAMSPSLDIGLLLAFAAGNFLYIAASDLVPEVKHGRGRGQGLLHAVALAAGIALLLVIRVALEP